MDRKYKAFALISVLIVLGALMTFNYMVEKKATEKVAAQQAEQNKKQQDDMKNLLQRRPQSPKKPKVVGTVTLYYIQMKESNLSLVPVTQKITSDMAKDTARNSLEILCTLTDSGNLKSPIPPNVKILGFNVNNGLATVNFSPELIRNFPGGSSWEAASLSAIVQTLTQFPNIQKVQILVDGKKQETLGGHIDISEPLSRNERF